MSFVSSKLTARKQESADLRARAREQLLSNEDSSWSAERGPARWQPCAVHALRTLVEHQRTGIVGAALRERTVDFRKQSEWRNQSDPSVYLVGISIQFD
jgi:hypothetical protein